MIDLQIMFGSGKKSGLERNVYKLTEMSDTQLWQVFNLYFEGNQKMRGIYLFFFALILFCIPVRDARANFFSGNDLLKLCDDRTEAQLEGYCLGYIIGVIDGVKAHLLLMVQSLNLGGAEEALRFEKSMPFCRPSSATNGQVMDIVIKYLKNNPERRDIDAELLIVIALIEAFRCERG